MASKRATGFPNDVQLCPPDWPPNCRDPHPGDLTQFIPQGLGFTPPLVAVPWGAPLKPSHYSHQAPSAHPFHAAPLTDGQGGTFYFKDRVAREALTAALALAGVQDGTHYAAYATQSHDPQQDRFLDQLRFVSDFALRTKWAVPDLVTLAPQTLSVAEAIWAFIEAQKQKWDNAALAGTAGGDPDNSESLAFGFHVENTYYGVYRVWSRPWIVTK